MSRPASVTTLLVCLVSLVFLSCVSVRRQITRPGAGKTPQALLVADRDTLLQKIVRQYEATRDFSATVDLVPALGTVEKSRITEYKDVRAFILFRKPTDIHIIGLAPVVRTKLFDMVSNGTEFKLYVSPRNRFVTGRNEIVQPSANKLENLRPQHFLDALIVRPVDANEHVLVENFTDEDNAFYILHEVRGNGSDMRLMRTIWFNRLDLQLARQLILDDTGNILTDARYSQWRAWDNVPFPKHVEINRPRDEYAVVIDMVKLDINTGLSDDKFVLEQPPGSTLQVIGQPPADGGGRRP